MWTTYSKNKCAYKLFTILQQYNKLLCNRKELITLTSSMIAYLSADHGSIIFVPRITTNCPPLSSCTHFHSSLFVTIASHQTNCAITALSSETKRIQLTKRINFTNSYNSCDNTLHGARVHERKFFVKSWEKTYPTCEASSRANTNG